MSKFSLTPKQVKEAFDAVDRVNALVASLYRDGDQFNVNPMTGKVVGKHDGGYDTCLTPLDLPKSTFVVFVPNGRGLATLPLTATASLALCNAIQARIADRWDWDCAAAVIRERVAVGRYLD